MNKKKDINILIILLITIIVTRCSSTSNDKAESNWLSSVNNTTWKSESKWLKFAPLGKNILKENGVQYYFCYAENSRIGVYFTDIKFSPTTWYVFHLTNNLIQYGPFLSTNNIMKQTSESNIFIKQ